MFRLHTSHRHALLVTVSRAAGDALSTHTHEGNITRARPTLDTQAVHGPAHTPGDCATAEGIERPRFRTGGALRRRPSFIRDEGASGPSRRPRKEVCSKLVLRPRHSNAYTCAETWCSGRARESVQWRSVRQVGTSEGSSARAGRGLPGRSSHDDGRQRATRGSSGEAGSLPAETLRRAPRTWQ